MTAREQARAAACTCSDPECDRYGGADAASDIWEPLLQAMVNAFEPPGVLFRFNKDMHEAITKAHEALGR